MQIEEEQGYVTFPAGDLTAPIATEGSWEMEFLHGGLRVTSCGDRSIGYMDTPEGALW